MTTTTESTARRSVAASHVQAGARSRAPILLGLGFLLTLAFFWPTLWSFTYTWRRFDYAHGWLVPPLVAWVVWTGRGRLRSGRGGDPLLLMPLVGLSVFWLVSTITHIQLFHQTAFVLLMVCWGLFVFGRKSARTVIVSGALFLLSLPIWDALLKPLARVATIMSGLISQLVGVPARVDGNLVHLPSGIFEVGDDCAGLNYLLAALVISIVYVQGLDRDRRTRFLVVGLAVTIAILGNWLRVAGLVVVGHLSEMQAWLVKDHIEYGFVIFGLGLVLFFFLAGKIERRTSPTGSVAESGADSDAAGAPTRAPASAAARATSAGTDGRLSRMGVASSLAVIGPVLFFGLSALPTANAQVPGLADLASPGWGIAEPGPERPFDWSPEYRGAQQHERLWFTDGARLVAGDRFVYREQRPNAKLIGWPNRLAPAGDVLDRRTVGPVDPPGRQWVQQAVVRTPQGTVLTWYWYRVGGVSTFTPVHAKALEIPAFLTRRRSSELMALSAACGPEDCGDALDALGGFMGTPGLAPSDRSGSGASDRP